MRFCLLVVVLDRAFDEAFERPTRFTGSVVRVSRWREAIWQPCRVAGLWATWPKRLGSLGCIDARDVEQV